MLAAADPHDLVPLGVDPDRLIANMTSGSSGMPLHVRLTWLEQSLHHVFRQRALRDFGYRLGNRIIKTRLGRSVHPNDNKLLRTLIRRLRIQPEIVVNVGLPLDQVAERMQAFDPHVIDGYPGYLERLAVHLGDQARKYAHPRFVTSGAETLLPHMRERIERTFGARVFDWYGAIEFDLIGWECRETGELHLCEDSIVAEIVRDGGPAATGDQGEMVVTSLHRYAMPFIRYRLGDVVTRGEPSCPCGAPFATLRAVEGRGGEYFTLANGRMIMALQIIRPMFGAFPCWIARFQIWQIRPDQIVLVIEPRGDAEPGELERLRQIAERELAAGATLEIRRRCDTARAERQV